MKTLLAVSIAILLSGLTVPFVNAQQEGPGPQKPPVVAQPSGMSGPQPGSGAQPSDPVKDSAKCTSYKKADYGEGNHIGDLSDNISVGSKAVAAAFRYNIATEKAAFNERTAGVGLSFRYYSDSQLANAGKTSIREVPRACRARTEDLLDFSVAKNGEKAKVGSLFSISPTIFLSKAETEGDVSIQPAIVVGFLNDIISIGTAYNLTGTGKGQWSLLIGPSYGFQW